MTEPHWRLRLAAGTLSVAIVAAELFLLYTFIVFCWTILKAG
jgi:hypothetical protein